MFHVASVHVCGSWCSCSYVAHSSARAYDRSDRRQFRCIFFRTQSISCLAFVFYKCRPSEQVVCTPVPLGGLDQRNVVIRHCSWLAGSSGYYDNCCPYMTPCSCHIIIARQCYCRPRAAAITTALPTFLWK